MMNISRETWLKQAQECIGYYEQLLHEQAPGQNWALGLVMAKQWYRMILQQQPDLEEASLLFIALDKDCGSGGCGGSQWCAMATYVGNWLESLEHFGDEG